MLRKYVWSFDNSRKLLTLSVIIASVNNEMVSFMVLSFDDSVSKLSYPESTLSTTLEL